MKLKISLLLVTLISFSIFLFYLLIAKGLLISSLMIHLLFISFFPLFFIRKLKARIAGFCILLLVQIVYFGLNLIFDGRFLF
ncbi:hypothetical protein SDC9_135553 [bioreactor metagenome]|uniref:Uncharacterized protein n=1 Tax=bioreactor metagenome TaxID=1076179 RepID=A0A645DGP1_9ZZZZ